MVTLGFFSLMLCPDHCALSLWRKELGRFISVWFCWSHFSSIQENVGPGLTPFLKDSGSRAEYKSPWLVFHSRNGMEKSRTHKKICRKWRKSAREIGKTNSLFLRVNVFFIQLQKKPHLFLWWFWIFQKVSQCETYYFALVTGNICGICPFPCRGHPVSTAKNPLGISS